jgi:hypothetical protein
MCVCVYIEIMMLPIVIQYHVVHFRNLLLLSFSLFHETWLPLSIAHLFNCSFLMYSNGGFRILSLYPYVKEHYQQLINYSAVIMQFICL